MARFDKAVGRYVYLTVEGVDYRVYFEESGSGIPLLLQHTAGVDARANGGSFWKTKRLREIFG